MRIPGIPYVQGRNSYTDRDGTKYGIAIHNTSNNASDEAEASYATRRADGISSHLYVDGDSVTQSLDLLARAGHAGSSEGNEHAIAVEIRGANGWSRQQWLDGVAWAKLGAVLAFVCRQFNVTVRRASVVEMKANPKIRAFYGHDDMRRAWGGTTHTDPGPNFPWDRLFQAVTAALGGTATTKGDDMAAGDADYVASNVPVPGKPGQVMGLHVAIGSLLADVAELKARPAATLDDATKAAILAELGGTVATIVGQKVTEVLGRTTLNPHG